MSSLGNTPAALGAKRPAAAVAQAWQALPSLAGGANAFTPASARAGHKAPARKGGLTVARTHLYRFLTLSIAGAFGALLCACSSHGPAPGPGPGELPPSARVDLIATEYQYNLKRVFAEPGGRLTVSMWNRGTMDHSFALELPGGARALPKTLAPGEFGEITVTVPEIPGDIAYYCPIDNHRALGMQGTLTVARPERVGLKRLATGLVHPVAMAVPGDGSGRRFVVDQAGVVWELSAGGELLPDPFLDIRDAMVPLNADYDERGLLGMAFHPEYAQNGRFFIYYSAPLRAGAPAGWNHTARLAELKVQAGDPSHADRSSEVVLLEVDEPQANHNAGTLAFGPDDGYLYLSLGDGGGAGDIDMGHTPGLGNGQDISKLLGKILRLDVSQAGQYSIPPDNPFAGAVEGADEIYAYGFRNPYRMSFDKAGAHDLFVGDVGQALWEEVSMVHNGGNYGWNILEGNHCFNKDDFEHPLPSCPDAGARGEPLERPIIEVANSELPGGAGEALVGGYVYRGASIPTLAGQYIFGMWSIGEDQDRGQLYMARSLGAPGEQWPVRRLITGGPGGTLGEFLLGLGQDEHGELYVLTTRESGPTGKTGTVWQIVPAE